MQICNTKCVCILKCNINQIEYLNLKLYFSILILSLFFSACKSNNVTASSSSSRHHGPKLASNVIEIVTEMVDAIELSIWDAVVDRVL